MKIPLRECAKHKWWHNFYNNDPHKFSLLKDINTALKKYNAHINNESHLHGHLVFETEQDYVLFVMRWS